MHSAQMTPNGVFFIRTEMSIYTTFSVIFVCVCVLFIRLSSYGVCIVKCTLLCHGHVYCGRHALLTK